MTEEDERAKPAAGVFLLDQALLEHWATRQWLTCRVCGERFSAGNLEAVIQHPLRHDDSPDTRSSIQRALADLRNLKRLPEAVKQEHMAWVIRRLASDPAAFKRLQREGVIVRLAGRG